MGGKGNDQLTGGIYLYLVSPTEASGRRTHEAEEGRRGSLLCNSVRQPQTKVREKVLVQRLVEAQFHQSMLTPGLAGRPSLLGV